MAIAKTEQVASYTVTPAKVRKTKADRISAEDAIIQQALEIMAKRVASKKVGDAITSPNVIKTYLTLQMADLEHEVFAVTLLNSQYQIIHHEIMFRGTLAQTSVYPREVVKLALVKNAAAVIFSHNHPSGTTTPSNADYKLTNTLKTALNLIDVRVLDHIIVAGMKTYSFAEHGNI